MHSIFQKFKFLFCFIFSILLCFTGSPQTTAAMAVPEADIVEAINQIFINRSTAMLNNDIELLNSLYDKNTKISLWAFQNEEKKMKYLNNWSEKQGIIITDITPTIEVKKIRVEKANFSANIICSTEYKYKYENEGDVVNSFRIGTYHNIQVMQNKTDWLITKEWYTDPYEDALNLENINSVPTKQYILEHPPRDFTNLEHRRLDALSYADQYCGAANDIKDGVLYNKQYRNYNPLGGDCANFASQILYEGGKFRKTTIWNYESGAGSRAWVNAHCFKDFWVRSGRATVLAYGNYEEVLKASYKLKPGDIVAYEKKGIVDHISVVTGADSKGYILVNCHNPDRFRVPWDLGWSNKSIRFWLISVHF